MLKTLWAGRLPPTLENAQMKFEALSQVAQRDLYSRPRWDPCLHHSRAVVGLLGCQWLRMSRTPWSSLRGGCVLPSACHLPPLHATHPIFSRSCLAVAHAATNTAGAPAIGKASYCSTSPSQRQNKPTVILSERRTSTPSKGDEPPEELPFREERNNQESVEVQSLHEEPAVVRHDAILKEDHGELTPSLRKERIISFCLGLYVPANRERTANKSWQTEVL